MTDATAPVAAAIASAQEQLQTALAALAALPIVEADALAVTRHTLHNYLALTGMTLEVVLRDLGPAADPAILSWLHGLQHVTDLMAHTVRRLGANASPGARAPRVRARRHRRRRAAGLSLLRPPGPAQTAHGAPGDARGHRRRARRFASRWRGTRPASPVPSRTRGQAWTRRSKPGCSNGACGSVPNPRRAKHRTATAWLWPRNSSTWSGARSGVGVRRARGPASRFACRRTRARRCNNNARFVDIAPVIRSKRMAGWKDWGHLPRLGQNG
jgi:hypothetical protein